MPNGILIIDKPEGWTSQDVVSKLKGCLHERRIGHGGTLDPLATGVLPVFVGRATRAVEFFEAADKEYVAGLRLGLRTDTEDITGSILSQSPVTIARETLLEALKHFCGEQLQLPPMYSAVKIGGKKLYELARQGKSVERMPRKIRIHSLELLDGAGEYWTIRVRCSKGTYIRTLCKDIGEALGCGGCMQSLRRTAAGRYKIEEAIPLEDFLRRSTVEQQAALHGIDTLFSSYPEFRCTQVQLRAVRNGAWFSVRVEEGSYRVYDQAGSFLMLGQVRQGKMYTVKSFFEPLLQE